MEKAYWKLENELHRTPSDRELAAELGMSEHELHSVFSQVSVAGLLALELMLSAGGDRAEPPPPDQGESALDGDGVDEMKQLLADALDRLPEPERIVLTLHHVEGLDLTDIGEVLGVTQRRLHQLHGKAVLQLRSRFSGARGPRLLTDDRLRMRFPGEARDRSH